MARISCFVITFLAVAALISVARSAVAPIMGAIPVDSLKRFPHHVTIGKIRNGHELYYCAGSILNDQWILTSAFCIVGSTQLQLHFEKLHSSFNDSYAAVVDASDAVHIYPTNNDDIALVRIPFRLIFSDTLKPVTISSSAVGQLDGRLAVMPGFDSQAQPIYPTPATTTAGCDSTPLPSSTPWWPPTTPSLPPTTTVRLDYTSTTEETTSTYETDPTTTQGTTKEEPQAAQNRLAFAYDQSHQLTYGMFNILSNTSCKMVISEFDEFLQLCTDSWSNVDGTPCYQDYGSGLLVGWPARPELVGIYSVMTNDCFSSNLVFTNVAKYASWIQSTIKG